ncbi:hypothetical protein DDE74_38065 [Streptomyces lydicus]|uniref:Uncharacterized protein n=1 Tax=Streptomyces lydicus TaxID=47763 RepID=A0A3Q9K7F8_9ACTN|nr:hypothetical protein DDE74_38065 [Streptomyces lydicus]
MTANSRRHTNRTHRAPYLQRCPRNPRAARYAGCPRPVGPPPSRSPAASPWFHLCYAPLVLWGPLLAVLTVAYWKRRRTAENAPAPA